MKKSLSFVAATAAVCFGVLAPSSSAIADACGGSLTNGSFEAPLLSSLVAGDVYLWPTSNTKIWNGVPGPATYAMINSLPGVDSAVSRTLGWRSSETAVEIQRPSDFAAADGNQIGEIVGVDNNGVLYQEVVTVPGTVMEWSLAHRGIDASGSDLMKVRIGADLQNLSDQNATPSTGAGVSGQPTHISDSTTWRTWTGTYTVPEGQTSTIFSFASISSVPGGSAGNLLDNVTFTCSANQPTIPAEPELASTGASSSFWTITAAGLVGAGILSIGRARYRKANSRKH